MPKTPSLSTIGPVLELHSYLLFIAASVALILVPGPAQALVIATTLDRGQRHGALTAVGLNVGTLFHAVAAGLGLSAILATSALAFSIVKYVGAAYLLYLGICALRSSRASDASRLSHSSPTSSRVAFGQAVLTGVLNPKVALFFLAFLPQFVDASRGAVMLQFLLLGLTMAMLDTLYELVLVHLTHRLKGRLSRSRRLETLRNRISGVVLILLGVRLALQER
jgi:threonine/homoserine/homoserine lactone efflux protein